MEINDHNKLIEELRASGKLIFCTACGEPNSSDDAFCGKCGERIIGSQTAQQQQAYQDTSGQGYQNAQGQYQGAYNYQFQNQYQSDHSKTGYAGANYGNSYSANREEMDPQVLRMVGENLEYYEPKFRLMKATAKKTSWNWPAFLVSPFWLFYRRMYVYGIIFIVATSILGGISAFILPILANIALGVFGNYIYMNFLEKTLSDASNLQEPYRSQNIASRTGANPTAVWIAVGIYFALGLIAVIALGGLFALSWGLY